MTPHDDTPGGHGKLTFWSKPAIHCNDSLDNIKSKNRQAKEQQRSQVPKGNNFAVGIIVGCSKFNTNPWYKHTLWVFPKHIHFISMGFHRNG